MKKVFHITPKHTVKNISLCMLFELKFSWNMSEETYAARPGTKAKQIIINICDYFLKDVTST